MTGRLRAGDRVTTPDGVGTIIACYVATDTRVGRTGWHVVLLDNSAMRKPYRTTEVEFLSRQLTVVDTTPELP